MTSNIWDEVGEETDLEVKVEELAEEALPEPVADGEALKFPFEEEEESSAEAEELTYEPAEDGKEEPYTIGELAVELCYSHERLIDLIRKDVLKEIKDLKKAVNKLQSSKDPLGKPKKAKRKSRAKAGVPGRPAKKLPKTKVPSKKTKKPASKPKSPNKTKVKGKGK